MKNSSLKFFLPAIIAVVFYTIQPLYAQQNLSTRIADYAANTRLTESFNKENRLCSVMLEPKETADNAPSGIILFETVERFVSSYITPKQHERLTGTFSFEASCTAVSIRSSDDLTLSETHYCNNKNGVGRVYIKWKTAGC